MTDERLPRFPRPIAALGVLFVGFALSTGALAHDDDDDEKDGVRDRMAGTYYLRVGAEPFVFEALMVLTPDGGLMAESDGAARFPDADLTATLGVWKPIDKKRRARMRFFLFDIVSNVTLARNRVTLIAKFNRKFDRFEGSFVLEAFSPEQDPLGDEDPAFGTLEGTLSARRILP